MTLDNCVGAVTEITLTKNVNVLIVRLQFNTRPTEHHNKELMVDFSKFLGKKKPNTEFHCEVIDRGLYAPRITFIIPDSSMGAGYILEDSYPNGLRFRAFTSEDSKLLPDYVTHLKQELHLAK